MAPTTPDTPDPDILDPAQFAALVGIRRVQTVTEWCAAGMVPGARKVGAREAGGGRVWGLWRIHFPTFYRALAGPGVPVGEILNSRQLAARLQGVPERTVRRALASGAWPGLKLGKVWLVAVPAIWQRFGWALDTAAGPAGHPPGAAAGDRPDGPRRPGAVRAADLAAEMPFPAGIRKPRAARAGGLRLGRRPAAPGGPGRSTAAR